MGATTCRGGLAWFRYRVDWDKLQSAEILKSDDLGYLIESGYVVYEATVYEDFLPYQRSGNLPKQSCQIWGNQRRVTEIGSLRQQTRV